MSTSTSLGWLRPFGLYHVDWLGTDGKWTAHVAGTQIAAARAGREDVYLHFGFQFKLHATTGIFKVFEDGLTMVDYAGDTIGATGATGINKILIGTTASAQKLTAYIDDLYIDNTAGESVFGPVPDLRFAWRAKLTVNANGEVTALTVSVVPVEEQVMSVTLDAI